MEAMIAQAHDQSQRLVLCSAYTQIQTQLMGIGVRTQPLNARLLVEKDLAVEVKRTEDWSFCKDDITKTLRHAMVAEDGEKLRSNSRKAAKVFGVTSSTKTTTLANLSITFKKKCYNLQPLAKAKVHVSFISTPKNIRRLHKISPDLQPFIHLDSIPFPALASGFLQEGAEATVNIPFEKMDI
ncbi:hypothetical protein L3X38_013550 [Prunus dulcis]|uniref:Uncharacterized protein n=1 Tax=Prunus dulcis TaxID=3755 RepID=A0AAD4WM60_PRUDU|nr:hypothetical protein L3X38_013550 [Prunus dulcis]